VKSDWAFFYRVREAAVCEDHAAIKDLLNRNDAVHPFGERSRLGCSSARPRAEHSGSHQHQTLRPFHASQSAARARLIAPEAGALPIPTAWIRLKTAAVV